MNCLICNANARELHNGFDGVECLCPACGRYGISRSLLATLRDRHFNIPDTRIMLTVMRGERPHTLAVITPENAYWERLQA